MSPGDDPILARLLSRPSGTPGRAVLLHLARTDPAALRALLLQAGPFVRRTPAPGTPARQALEAAAADAWGELNRAEKAEGRFQTTKAGRQRAAARLQQARHAHAALHDQVRWAHAEDRLAQLVTQVRTGAVGAFRRRQARWLAQFPGPTGAVLEVLAFQHLHRRPLQDRAEAVYTLRLPLFSRYLTAHEAHHLLRQDLGETGAVGDVLDELLDRLRAEPPPAADARKTPAPGTPARVALEAELAHATALRREAEAADVGYAGPRRAMYQAAAEGQREAARHREARLLTALDEARAEDLAAEAP